MYECNNACNLFPNYNKSPCWVIWFWFWSQIHVILQKKVKFVRIGLPTVIIPYLSDIYNSNIKLSLLLSHVCRIAHIREIKTDIRYHNWLFSSSGSENYDLECVGFDIAEDIVWEIRKPRLINLLKSIRSKTRDKMR